MSACGLQESQVSMRAREGVSWAGGMGRVTSNKWPCLMTSVVGWVQQAERPRFLYGPAPLVQPLTNSALAHQHPHLQHCASSCLHTHTSATPPPAPSAPSLNHACACR